MSLIRMYEYRRMWLAQKIVSRRRAARGILVLDENLFGLNPALRFLGFTVYLPTSGMKDEEIKQDLVHHGVFVTANTKHFIKDARKYDYGIISLDRLSFIDTEPKRNITAKVISRAWIDFQLASRGREFVLELRDNGKHVLKSRPS